MLRLVSIIQRGNERSIRLAENLGGRRDAKSRPRSAKSPRALLGTRLRQKRVAAHRTRE
jgi:RimJ/RimL family protein N-acetyltransferase